MDFHSRTGNSRVQSTMLCPFFRGSGFCFYLFCFVPYYTGIYNFTWTPELSISYWLILISVLPARMFGFHSRFSTIWMIVPLWYLQLFCLLFSETLSLGLMIFFSVGKIIANISSNISSALFSSHPPGVLLHCINLCGPFPQFLVWNC